MDNHWPSDVVEFGAINITGFRIVDTNRRALRDFHDSRKRLEPHTAGGGNGASLPAISVNVQKNYELLFTIAISIPPLSLSLPLFPFTSTPPTPPTGPGRTHVRRGLCARRGLQSHSAQEAGSVSCQSSTATQPWRRRRWRHWLRFLCECPQRVQRPVGLQHIQGLGNTLGAGRENIASFAQGKAQKQKKKPE